MKQLLISLFTSLATVLAVFNVFTTKSIFEKYEVWGITTCEVGGNQISLPSYSTVHAEIEQTLYTSSSPLSSGLTNHEKLDNFVEAYKLAHQLLQLCASRNDFICIAYVSTTSEAVLAVKEGCFDPE
jgi:hypothetical protein